MSGMKWALIAVAVVVALVVVAVLAVPYLVDMPRVQAAIAGQVSTALGRPVKFSGLSVRVLPLPSVVLRDLEIGEDPAFGTDPFLRLDSGALRLKVGPLLRGRVEFGELVLRKPVIAVIQNPDGRLNVATLGAAAEAKTPPPPARDAPGAPTSSPSCASIGITEMASTAASTFFLVSLADFTAFCTAFFTAFSAVFIGPFRLFCTDFAALAITFFTLDLGALSGAALLLLALATTFLAAFLLDAFFATGLDAFAAGAFAALAFLAAFFAAFFAAPGLADEAFFTAALPLAAAFFFGVALADGALLALLFALTFLDTFFDARRSRSSML